MDNLLPKVEAYILELKQLRSEAKRLYEEQGDLSVEFFKTNLSKNIKRKDVVEDCLRSSIAGLLEVYYLIKDLWHLVSNGQFADKELLALYFPIHVCSSLRMFNWGPTNLVNSKKLRCLASPPEQTEAIDADKDEVYRFYITAQKAKATSLKKAISKEEIKDTVVLETFRNPFKFSFYRELYLKNQPFLI